MEMEAEVAETATHSANDNEAVAVVVEPQEENDEITDNTADDSIPDPEVVAATVCETNDQETDEEEDVVESKVVIENEGEGSVVDAVETVGLEVVEAVAQGEEGDGDLEDGSQAEVDAVSLQEEEDEEEGEEEDDSDDEPIRKKARTEKKKKSKKKKKEPKSSSGIPAVKNLGIPFRAIKRIMKIDKNIATVQNEAAMVATYAVKLFVTNLVERSYDKSKKRGRNTVK